MERSFDRHIDPVQLAQESSFRIPLRLAELLHCTLGPLADQLAAEGHAWEPMVRRTLAEYTELRNAILRQHHGNSVLAEIKHETFLASEWLCALTALAVHEATDFVQWASEVEGDPV